MKVDGFILLIWKLFILYLGKEERCRANIGFLVDKSASLGEEGWNQTKLFIVQIAKSLDIGEDETNVAVTTFEDKIELQIKFSDHTNYSSFEKAVYAIDDRLAGTNTIGGIKFAYEEMFNAANGMRIGVPNAMLFMTDGDCRSDNCTTAAFEYWNNMYRNIANPPIKLIGIGIGDKVKVEEIETFVGKENYYGSNITEIIKPDFIRNLQICDSMYSCLVLILIRIQMEFVIDRTIFVTF